MKRILLPLMFVLSLILGACAHKAQHSCSGAECKMEGHKESCCAKGGDQKADKSCCKDGECKMENAKETCCKDGECKMKANAAEVKPSETVQPEVPPTEVKETEVKKVETKKTTTKKKK